MRPLSFEPWLARPYALQVEITSVCNLTCRMCPLILGTTDSGQRPGHVQDATWSEVVRAAREIGSVNLTGFGEPTTNPRFLAMLRELDQANVQMSFSTNGIGISRDILDGLKGLRHLHCVNVSIGSPDPETYRRIRGGKVSKALHGLSQLSRTLRPRVLITVSSVALHENAESLLSFPGILVDIGIDTYTLQEPHDQQNKLDSVDAKHHPDFPSLAAAIGETCRELGVPFKVELRRSVKASLPDTNLPFSPRNTRQCITPWSVPFVDRDGRVFPCCLADGTAVMGELGEASLLDIWSGERFRKFRTDLVSGEHMPRICRDCTAGIPLGPHPRLFTAEIDREQSQLGGHSKLRLVARNTGGAIWTREQPIAIGRIGDADSSLWLPHWASSNRIFRQSGGTVPPGGELAIEFDIARTWWPRSETFALVVEGQRWLEGTTFRLPQ